MRKFTSNRIFVKTLLSMGVLVVFFLPVSTSLNIAAATTTPSVAATVVGAVGGGVWNGLLNTVGNSMLSASALATYIAGNLLESVLDFSVYQMGAKVHPKEPLGASINTIWMLIRDICNLAFIFGFIFVGIRTIADPDSASTKRMLSRIIIGALLINFSLFFTKAIIDFSNFTALQIFNGMTSGTGSISTTLVDQLGIITIYNVSPDALVKMFKSQTSFSFFIMASVFLLITAFTFFAAALLLIVRFVALILIMVASPILFAAWIFPATEKMSNDLWGKLFSYSFFAPIYLLLILVSIKMIEGLELKPTGRDGIAEVLAAGQSNFATILNFTVIIFFMIAALAIASRMGVAGGKMAVNVGNNLRGKAQGAIAGRLGRTFVGAPAHWAQEKYEHLDAKASKESWGTKKGFALKTIRGGVAAIAGGDKGLRGVLHAGADAKFGSADSYESMDKYKKERKARQAKINVEDEKTAAIAAGLDAPAGSAKRIKMEQTIAGATIKFIEELKEKERKNLAQYYTQAQMDAIDKSTEITEKEKKDIHDIRFNSVKQQYSDALADGIPKASNDQITTLGYDFFQESKHAVRLTSSQMDELKKKLTKTEFDLVVMARKQGLIDAANSAETKSIILKQKPGEIAKMPKEVLTKVAGDLPVQVFDKIRMDGTLSNDDQKEVREAFFEAYKGMEGEDATEIYDWLTKSPYGKQFGVGV